VAEPPPIVVSDAAAVKPAETGPIAVKVKFSPRKLNLDGHKGKGHKGKGHKGGHLKAKIEFAEGFDARSVDPSSVRIVAHNGSEIVADAKKKRGFFDKLAKNHHKPKKSISVKFDRQQVIEALGCSTAKETTLTVHGEFLDGDSPQTFEVSGVIRLKMKKGSHCSAD